VLFQLSQMQQQEKPVLQQARLIPSRQRRLRQKIKKLSLEQYQWVLKINKNPEELHSVEFEKISEVQQAEVLDALIDYTAFLKKKSKPQKVDVSKVFRPKLLLKRSKLPIAKSEGNEERSNKLNVSSESKSPEFVSPTQGLPYTRTRLAWTHNSITGNALEFGIWNTYHDLLAEDSGHLPDSELVTLDMKFRANSEEVWFHQIDFVRLQNLSRSYTGLPEEQAWSWRARAALLHQEHQCKTCRYLHFSGAMGKALSFSEQDLEFAFLGLFANIPQDKLSQSSAGWMPALGMTFNSGELWKLHAEVRYLKSFWGEDQKKWQKEVQQRLKLPNNWDMRLEWTSQESQELRVALHHYW